MDELFGRMEIVLKRIRSVGCKLKPRKCALCPNEVAYLGFHIAAAGVTPLHRKLQNVQKWPLPVTVNDIRVFPGFVNRYFTFYRKLARVTRPLASATGKLRTDS